MNWLAFYNKEGIGDVLLLTNQNSDGIELTSESIGKVTLVKNAATNEVVAINIFDQSDKLGLEGNGPVELTRQQVKLVNELLKSEKIDTLIEVDNSSKFVVGYVLECIDQPDSDHLHITQTQVSENETLQIVCGAANIKQGLKVLVAKPGAVMPSGLIIWPGQLRGEVSNGMICSTRELNLTNIEDKPGIWVLDYNCPIGCELKTLLNNQ